MNALLDLLLSLGVPAALVAIIIALLASPRFADALRLCLVTLPYWLFRFFARIYSSSAINLKLNNFFKSDVNRYIPSLPDLNLRIKWASTTEDPIIKEGGEVLVRIKDSADQTRNILMATQQVLPFIVCPIIRNRMDRTFSNTLDHAILRRLSRTLGDSAYVTYQRHFLDEHIDKGLVDKDKFHKLVELDNGGLLIPIFAEELTALGIKLSDTEDLSDRSEVISDFLDFLLRIAKREPSSTSELEFIKPPIKVCVLLMAKSWRMETEGLAPYLYRIRRHFSIGAEKVYIIAYPKAKKFLKELVQHLQSDLHIRASNVVAADKVVTQDTGGAYGREDGVYLSTVIRSKEAISTLFSQELHDRNFSVGEKVTGSVIAAHRDYAVVDVEGMEAQILLEEVSWLSQESCAEVLAPETTEDFLIFNIDHESERFFLTKRFPGENPWHNPLRPNVGDRIEVAVRFHKPGHLVALYQNLIEVLIPESEVSWVPFSLVNQDQFLDTDHEVVIYDLDEVSERVLGSLKRMHEDPWKERFKKLPPGTKTRAPVCKIQPNVVVVDLSEGLLGEVPREHLVEAGHEYADFTETFVLGQRLDLVVSKVDRKKQRIKLNLQRNLAPR